MHCPPPTPHAKAPVSRRRPLESPQWYLHTYVGQESSGSLRLGLTCQPGWAPLTPADNVLWGLDWSPAMGTRRPDEGNSSSLSVFAPGDDLNHPHLLICLCHHSFHRYSLTACLLVVGAGLSVALDASLPPGCFLGTNKDLTPRRAFKEQIPSLSTWKGESWRGVWS